MFSDDPLNSRVRTNRAITEERFNRPLPVGRAGVLVRRVTGQPGSSDPNDIWEVRADDAQTFHIRRRDLDLI